MFFFPSQIYLSLTFLSQIIHPTGDALTHVFYDSAQVVLHIEGQLGQAKQLVASQSTTNAKGAKRRTYSTADWGETFLSANTFRDHKVGVSLVVSDVKAILKAAHSGEGGGEGGAVHLPTLSNTTVGSSPNSVYIPLHRFMKASFEVKVMLEVTPPWPKSKSLPPSPLTQAPLPLHAQDKSNAVFVTIQGYAHEAKAELLGRIQNMKPSDLMTLNLDSYLSDSDDSGDDWIPDGGLSDNDYDFKDLLMDESSHSGGGGASPGVSPGLSRRKALRRKSSIKVSK